MTATAKSPRIVIAGREAREISQHVHAYVLRHGVGWHEVQGMRECAYGCKLYVRQRGAVLEYQLFHSTSYGCQLGKDDATRTARVSVRPKAVAA